MPGLALQYSRGVMPNPHTLSTARPMHLTPRPPSHPCKALMPTLSLQAMTPPSQAAPSRLSRPSHQVPLGLGGALDLLATAALTAQAVPAAGAVITPTPLAIGAVITPTPLATHPTLSAPGPFNPAAAVPVKVVKRILDLEFVEIAEISVEVDTPQVPGRPPPPARPPITDISQWVERFSLMAAILSTRFPEKAPEFWAYQASIVRAERNYEGTRWVSYDRQFWREALARKDLNWSVTDPRLYNEAFTGRARTIARCIFCLQDDHVAAQCPQNPNRPIFTWCPDPASWSAQVQPVPYRPPAQQHPSREVCRRFNEGKCRVPKCKYLHSCSGCQGAHPYIDCTRRVPTGRSCSSIRTPYRGVPHRH